MSPFLAALLVLAALATACLALAMAARGLHRAKDHLPEATLWLLGSVCLGLAWWVNLAAWGLFALLQNSAPNQ